MASGIDPAQDGVFVAAFCGAGEPCPEPGKCGVAVFVRTHAPDGRQTGEQGAGVIIETLVEAHEILGDLLRKARAGVGFTGAGLSTECGIPDFRSKNSPWRVNRPIEFSQFVNDPRMRAEAWRRKFAMDDLYAGARPGRGHRALANLVADGALAAIVTQNIDGLHQQSGVADEKIIELHGNGTYAKCLSCGVRVELADVRSRFEGSGEAPLCQCGGLLKSGTISFGQAMPENAMARTRRLTEHCDLFLAIGSSLVVHPAAGFPLLAKASGAALVIINGAPTPCDEVADVVLRGDIGEIFAPFA